MWQDETAKSKGGDAALNRNERNSFHVERGRRSAVLRAKASFCRSEYKNACSRMELGGIDKEAQSRKGRISSRKKWRAKRYLSKSEDTSRIPRGVMGVFRCPSAPECGVGVGTPERAVGMARRVGVPCVYVRTNGVGRAPRPASAKEHGRTSEDVKGAKQTVTERQNVAPRRNAGCLPTPLRPRAQGRSRRRSGVMGSSARR